MFGQKLLGTIGVLAATALAPATAAHAAPAEAPHVVNRGTQVGSEGVRSAQTDGIIAVLIGATAPREQHLAHGCPYCPHPANIATDGIGAVIEAAGQEYPNKV